MLQSVLAVWGVCMCEQVVRVCIPSMQVDVHNAMGNETELAGLGPTEDLAITIHQHDVDGALVEVTMPDFLSYLNPDLRVGQSDVLSFADRFGGVHEGTVSHGSKEPSNVV